MLYLKSEYKKLVFNIHNMYNIKKDEMTNKK